ncbi:MAG TPA: beta-ketoacyl-ACP synthase II [Armatimonadota bacterium]|jgi:beta-ketoacyl-acyl-carrier-protein synthase II
MQNLNRRVVITGMGVVSPVGIGLGPFWDGLRNGRSGIKPITLFDATDFRVRFAGEVTDFDVSQWLDRKEAKRMDRVSQFGVAASLEAVKDAGLEITDENRDQVGVFIGSGIGGLRTLEDQIRVLVERGPDRVTPFLIPMMIAGITSGHVSMILNARGPNEAVATACATANHAIGDAAHIIARGDADVMIAGGAEAAITPIGVAGFAAMKALSTRNDDPTRASRPWDRDRDGFVLGEGSGIVVLEERDQAIARGARIYAELSGYGLSADAYHITSPSEHGEGAQRAMRMTLRTAGLQPSEVDYINAHGTSTGHGDIAESQAIQAVFGEDTKVLVSSTKSMTGHLLGAAGGIESVACLLAMQHQEVPPTINLDNVDPACTLDYVPHTARKADLNVTMTNSFGFGGHNATLLFKRHD